MKFDHFKGVEEKPVLAYQTKDGDLVFVANDGTAAVMSAEAGDVTFTGADFNPVDAVAVFRAGDSVTIRF